MISVIILVVGRTQLSHCPEGSPTAPVGQQLGLESPEGSVHCTISVWAGETQVLEGWGRWAPLTSCGLATRPHGMAASGKTGFSPRDQDPQVVSQEGRNQAEVALCTIGGTYRGPLSFKVLEEHVRLEILLKPVLENTICCKSFKLFKSSELFCNTNVKNLFSSLTFSEKLMGCCVLAH